MACKVSGKPKNTRVKKELRENIAKLGGSLGTLRAVVDEKYQTGSKATQMARMLADQAILKAKAQAEIANEIVQMINSGEMNAIALADKPANLGGLGVGKMLWFNQGIGRWMWESNSSVGKWMSAKIWGLPEGLGGRISRRDTAADIHLHKVMMYQSRFMPEYVKLMREVALNDQSSKRVCWSIG